MGASLADGKKALPSAGQFLWAYGPTLVDDHFEVGTVLVEVTLYFRNDHLVKVDMAFPTSAFREMKALFVQKYGPPTKTGTQYGDPVLTWRGKVIELVLERDTDPACRPRCKSGVLFSVIADQAELDRVHAAEHKQQKEIEKEKKKKAKDAF